MNHFSYALIVAVALSGPAVGFAQFSGKLVYDNGTAREPRTIVYWQDGDRARVDRKEDRPVDTLLYDFSDGSMVRLSTELHGGIQSSLRGEMSILGLFMTDGPVITNNGQEQVNGYACTHYHIHTNCGSWDRDVWITKDLGIPSLMIFEAPHYLAPGHPFMKRLLAAGGAGVVVRMVPVDPRKPSLNLVSADRTAPDPATFRVPQGYKVVDMRKYEAP
jgi:hypothetical protein